MTSVELRKLNAYPEWRNDNMIDAVTQYVQAILIHPLINNFIQHKEKDNDLFKSFNKGLEF